MNRTRANPHLDICDSSSEQNDELSAESDNEATVNEFSEFVQCSTNCPTPNHTGSPSNEQQNTPAVNNDNVSDYNQSFDHELSDMELGSPSTQPQLDQHPEQGFR